jgi:hypothetical protein
MKKWARSIVYDCQYSSQVNWDAISRDFGNLGWTIQYQEAKGSSTPGEEDIIEFEAQKDRGRFDPLIFAILLNDHGIKEAETLLELHGNDDLVVFEKIRRGFSNEKDFHLSIKITFKEGGCFFQVDSVGHT